MERRRIRWSKLLRIIGCLGAGIALIAVVGRLLEQPAPPPIPADVGLAFEPSRPAQPPPQRSPPQRSESPGRERRDSSPRPPRSAPETSGPPTKPARPRPAIEPPLPVPSPPPSTVPPIPASPPSTGAAGATSRAPAAPQSSAEFGWER